MALDLGFVNESCKLLDSRFFPSKVGGKPAWLDLKFIPNNDEIICGKCGIPRYFLCQLYCPIDEKDTAFHRTLFVFICLSKDCFQPNDSSNFVVFRNQLSLHNPYYPDTPPVDDIHWRPDINCATYGTKLCSLCGTKGDVHCENECEDVFCSEHHKRIHIRCQHEKHPEIDNTNFKLLPQHGLSIEPSDHSEENSENNSDSECENDDPNLKSQQNKLNLAQLCAAEDDDALNEIFTEFSENNHDKLFLNFKSCIALQPKQVIRYCRNSEPLWLTEKNRPSTNSIPSCEYCGSDRQFEFQILPQLLNYLNLDEGNDYLPGVMDWGTLVIYTCKNSCDERPVYKKEFLWKQDLTI